VLHAMQTENTHNLCAIERFKKVALELYAVVYVRFIRATYKHTLLNGRHTQTELVGDPERYTTAY
jgi:hypothetical protein